jgi:pimeloyl-ACP methyl ester carboxylesterase
MIALHVALRRAQAAAGVVGFSGALLGPERMAGELRSKPPVLLIHGDADSVVPFAHGERLFALANEPKQFVRMPGSDHATLARDGLYDHIWSFLDQHPPE